MAWSKDVLRTSVLFLLFLNVPKIICDEQSWISSFKIEQKECSNEFCNFLLSVKGTNLENVIGFTTVPANRGCACVDIVSNFTHKVNNSNNEIKFALPVNGSNYYFCLKIDENSRKWIHQGADLYVMPSDVISHTKTSNNETGDASKCTESSDKDLDTLNEIDSHTIEEHLDHDIDVNNGAPSIKDEEENDVIIENIESPLQEIDGSYNEYVLPNKIREDGDENIVRNNFRRKREANGSEVYRGNLKITGFRVEEADKEPKIVDGGIPSVLLNTKFVLRLFGDGFTNDTLLAFSHVPARYGEECRHMIPGEHKVQSTQLDSALFKLIAPEPIDGYKFYICLKNPTSPFYVHQGEDEWKILATHNKLLPLWVSILLIIVLLMLASLFSGLNLGLMALDRTELKIIANTGTEKERRYARAIMPVRSHGNYLLCTILLSNVAVNSTFTVILDDLTSGLVAVIGSTLAIVFIAEITPQAICARHGLFVGAKSIWIMKIVMGICAPLAWPTSKLLDYFLGEEIGTHYNRERLKELVKVTNHVNDLDKEEVNIISGALDLRKKTVTDVMTKLEDVFMLPITSILDFETMSEIIKSGYSRIPVYEGKRSNIITVLFIKDLAFVDPDDNTPLRTLCQYYQNPCNFVFEDITLDHMLKQFKEGHKGHMAFVQRIKEGDGDPIYETVGLVTLEDVIEEMIQAEIVDETDVFTDNRSRRRLSRPINKLQNLAAFASHHEAQRVHISPQLVLATFQFLSTSVDPFRPDLISETVLRRLLKQDIIQHIKLKGDESKTDPSIYVFQENKPVDYFVLLLEGRVEVTVGRENLVFEAGPFTYFGVQALTQNVGVAESQPPSRLGSLQNLNMDTMLRHTFVPDYSVRAITELYYVTIKRSMYLGAKRATLMEKNALNRGGTNEQIEPEVDKLLQSGFDEQLKDPLNIVEKSMIKDTPPYSLAPRAPQEDTNLVNPEEEKLLKK